MRFFCNCSVVINIGGHNNIHPSSGFTFDNIAWIATAEIILICRFLSGNTNTHQIPGRVNQLFRDDSFYSNGYFKIPDVNTIIKTIVSQYVDIKDVIVKLINSSYNMNGFLKDDILCLLEFACSNNIIDAFMNLYFIIRSRYKVNGYQAMSTNQVADTELKKIYFNQWLKKNFYLSSADKRSNILRCAFEVLKRKYGGNEGMVIEKISDFIKEKGISIVFLNSDYTTESIDNVEMTCGMLLLDSTRDTARLDLISNLTNYITLPFTSNKRATEEEMSRLVHGWAIYKSVNNKNQSILDNYAYGFCLTRNFNWIKNRRSLFRQYFAKPAQFRRIIDGARRFSVEEFNSERVLAYINSIRSVPIQDDATNLFNLIRKIDIEIMNEANVFELIKNMSDVELLSTFMVGSELNKATNALTNLPSLLPCDPIAFEAIPSDDIVRQIAVNPRASRANNVVLRNNSEPAYASDIKHRLSCLESDVTEIKNLNIQNSLLLHNVLKALNIKKDESNISQSVGEIEKNVEILKEEPSIDLVNSIMDQQNKLDDLLTDEGSLTLKNNFDYASLLSKLREFYTPRDKFTFSQARLRCLSKNIGIAKDEYEGLFKLMTEAGEFKLHHPRGKRKVIQYTLTVQK